MKNRKTRFEARVGLGAPEDPTAQMWRERWTRERARVETLAAMVKRASAEIRSKQFREDLLADLETTLKEE